MPQILTQVRIHPFIVGNFDKGVNLTLLPWCSTLSIFPHQAEILLFAKAMILAQTTHPCGGTHWILMSIWVDPGRELCSHSAGAGLTLPTVGTIHSR